MVAWSGLNDSWTLLYFYPYTSILSIFNPILSYSYGCGNELSHFAYLEKKKYLAIYIPRVHNNGYELLYIPVILYAWLPITSKFGWYKVKVNIQNPSLHLALQLYSTQCEKDAGMGPCIFTITFISSLPCLHMHFVPCHLNTLYQQCLHDNEQYWHQVCNKLINMYSCLLQYNNSLYSPFGL